MRCARLCSWVTLLSLLASCGPEERSDQPSVEVDLSTFSGRSAGLRLASALAEDDRREGSWGLPEWDGAGFGFAWAGPEGAGWRLDRSFPTGAVVRVRARAAEEGQTLAIGDKRLAVTTDWSLLTFTLDELVGELTLVPGGAQTVEGDPRALGVAVQWVEVGPPGSDSLVERASHLDIGTPAAREALLQGWASDEVGGDGLSWSWSVGPESTVVLPASGRSIELDLRLRAFRWEGADPATLEVLANGDSVAQLAIDGDWQLYRLRLPSSSVRAGDNTLTLRPSPIASPESVGLGADKRELGIAVDRLEMSTMAEPALMKDEWLIEPAGEVVWRPDGGGVFEITYGGELSVWCQAVGAGRVLELPVVDVSGCEAVVFGTTSEARIVAVRGRS